MSQRRNSKVVQKAEFNSNKNKFWQYLQGANGLHLSVKEKYNGLLRELKADGVAFSDIKKRMMKEAKRNGLHRKTHYDSSNQKMVYRTEKSLRDAKVAWFHELELFLQFVKRNYRDYGVPAEKKNMKGVDKSKKSAVITRKTDSHGNTTEVRTEVIGANVQRTTGGINSPVVSELTLIQRQQVILQNFSVLGGIAESKGRAAIEAFNHLMVALGQSEEIIDIAESVAVGTEERQQILSSEVPTDGPFAGGGNPVRTEAHA